MQPGDKVQWTHTSRRGRTISMQLKEGVIESIAGAVATVKTGKNNRRVEINARNLQLVGQRSQIDAFVEAVREASRGAS